MGLMAVTLIMGLSGCEPKAGRTIQPGDFAAKPANPTDPALKKRLGRDQPSRSDSSEAESARPAVTRTAQPAPREPARPTTQAQGSKVSGPPKTAAGTQPESTPTASTELAGEAGPEPVQQGPGGEGESSTLAVGGMVGQVNGQAIYAHRVFKPIHEQLRALGRQHDRSGFRQRARELIQSQLRSLVADRLILGQAMRDLSDREQQGLKHMVQKKREELLRRYGRGSLAVAEKRIEEQTGQTLEQYLESFEQKAVVRRYMKQKLYPKVNVSHQDVINYYNEHPEKYQAAVKRKVRLMRLPSKEQAQQMISKLKEGASFKALANQSVNQFNANQGGLLGTQTGSDALQGPLNEVLLDLESGEFGGPVAFSDSYWLIYCEQLNRKQGQSLRDVQLDIRQKLRSQRFRERSQAYRRRLFEQGSFESIQAMTDRLVDIAVSRYAAAGQSTVKARPAG
jgi:hypothetical protein